MASQNPLSIILCGKNRAVGQPVIDHLKPEYDVVNFVDSLERGVEEIPAALRNDGMFAVVLGGGYDDQAFEKIKQAATGPEYKEVYWARADMSQAPVNASKLDLAAYAENVKIRTKDKLNELRDSEPAKSETFFF